MRDRFTITLLDYDNIVRAAEAGFWDMGSKRKTTVDVTVAPALRHLFHGASTVQAQGETVGQLLDNLDREFPGFKGHMINKGKVAQCTRRPKVIIMNPVYCG